MSNRVTLMRIEERPGEHENSTQKEVRHNDTSLLKGNHNCAILAVLTHLTRRPVQALVSVR